PLTLSSRRFVAAYRRVVHCPAGLCVQSPKNVNPGAVIRNAFGVNSGAKHLRGKTRRPGGEFLSSPLRELPMKVLPSLPLADVESSEVSPGPSSPLRGDECLTRISA